MNYSSLFRNTRLLDATLRFAAESNLIIAFCALCATWQTGVLLKGVFPSVELLTVVACGTFIIYNYPAYTLFRRSIPETRFKVSGGFRLKLLRAMIVLAAVAGIQAILQLPRNVWPVIAGLGLISFFYYRPAHGRSLKKIIGLKVFLVALIWTLVTVWLPMIESGMFIPDASGYHLLAERFVFMVALCLPFDMRDIRQDAKEEILTFPRLFGNSFTLRLAMALMAVFVLLVILNPFYAIKPVLWALIFSGIWTLEVISRTRPGLNLYFYNYLADGMLVLQAVLVGITAY